MTRAAILSGLAAVAMVGTAVAWRAEPAPATDATAAPVDGAMVFRAKSCAACHSGPETTAPIGDTFPSLADAPAWAGERRPGLTAAEYLAESIREPWAFTSPAHTGGGPAGGMPQLGLSDAEIAAVVDYLLTS